MQHQSTQVKYFRKKKNCFFLKIKQTDKANANSFSTRHSLRKRITSAAAFQKRIIQFTSTTCVTLPRKSFLLRKYQSERLSAISH